MVSRPDPTNAARKHRMRQKRKGEGLVEVRAWLKPEIVEYLDGMDCDSRAHAVSRILNREISK